MMVELIGCASDARSIQLSPNTSTDGTGSPWCLLALPSNGYVCSDWLSDGCSDGVGGIMQHGCSPVGSGGNTSPLMTRPSG